MEDGRVARWDGSGPSRRRQTGVVDRARCWSAPVCDESTRLVALDSLSSYSLSISTVLSVPAPLSKPVPAAGHLRINSVSRWPKDTHECLRFTVNIGVPCLACMAAGSMFQAQRSGIVPTKEMLRWAEKQSMYQADTDGSRILQLRSSDLRSAETRNALHPTTCCRWLPKRVICL